MAAPENERRRIMFFADYVCPFSYLSAQALESVRDELGLEVIACAFELRPAPLALSDAWSDEEWQIVSDLAAEAGVRIERPGFRPRTRKAHEAVKYAATIDRHAELQRAIFDAYFLEARDIGRIDVIVQIGAQLGIDATLLKVKLDVDAHVEEVLSDARLAEQLEIEGTPAFVAGSDARVGYLSAHHLREWLKD